MTIKMKDIAWLGGLLEGEGCFRLHTNRYPNIRLGMTAEDTVRKVAAMWDVRVYRNRNLYNTQIFSSSAIFWMITLYPYLGKCRQEKIAEIILFWRENSRSLIPTCHPNREVHALGLCQSCYGRERYKKKERLLEMVG